MNMMHFAPQQLNQKSLLFFIGIVCTFTCILPSKVHAKIFRNAYVQFELPEQWNCSPEGTEWVCSSINKVDSKESIIIMTAKEAGPQDTFAAYQNYLKLPKKLFSSSGKPVMSQIKNVRLRKINDQQWVDSLHLGSEIPGYYTRYVATIKDKLAILVSLSAFSSHYTRYTNDFFRAVESLRVVASKDLLTSKALAPIKPGTEAFGTGGMPATLPGSNDDNGVVPPTDEDNGNNLATYGGIGLLFAAIGFYIYMKRKN
jgi:LPXTG-motif cell wall-anchored protein